MIIIVGLILLAGLLIQVSLRLMKYGRKHAAVNTLAKNLVIAKTTVGKKYILRFYGWTGSKLKHCWKFSKDNVEVYTDFSTWKFVFERNELNDCSSFDEIKAHRTLLL